MNVNPSTSVELDQLDGFLSELVTQAHGQDFPEALRQAMKKDLAVLFQDHINRAVLALLTEGDLADYNVLALNQADGDEVFDFLTARIPNLEAVMKLARDAFAQDYLRSIQLSKQS